MRQGNYHQFVKVMRQLPGRPQWHAHSLYLWPRALHTSALMSTFWGSCDCSSTETWMLKPPQGQTIGSLSLPKVTWAAIFSVLVWMSDKASVAGEATWTEIHTSAGGGGSADNLLSLCWIWRNTWPHQPLTWHYTRSVSLVSLVAIGFRSLCAETMASLE